MNRNVNRSSQPYPNFAALLRSRPHALARIEGSAAYPDLFGVVRFYRTDRGVLTVAELYGLPTGDGSCDSPVFGFHIHEGGSCTGDERRGGDPFSGARMHYNPHGCPHPYHSGDLPPLFSAGGYAFLSFLSDRFTVEEIVGKTVIVHSRPDDFRTQPSGNAGEKIACGEIIRGRLQNGR